MIFIKKIICILLVSCFIMNTSYISNIYADPRPEVYDDDDDDDSDNDGGSLNITNEKNILEQLVDMAGKNRDKFLFVTAVSFLFVTYTVYTGSQEGKQISKQVAQEGKYIGEFVELRRDLANLRTEARKALVDYLKKTTLSKEQMMEALKKIGLSEKESAEVERLLDEVEKSRSKKGSQVDPRQQQKEMDEAQKKVQEVAEELRVKQQAYSKKMLTIIHDRIFTPTENLDASVEQLRTIANVDHASEKTSIVDRAIRNTETIVEQRTVSPTTMRTGGAPIYEYKTVQVAELISMDELSPLLSSPNSASLMEYASVESNDTVIRRWLREVIGKIKMLPNQGETFEAFYKRVSAGRPDLLKDSVHKAIGKIVGTGRISKIPVTDLSTFLLDPQNEAQIRNLLKFGRLLESQGNLRVTVTEWLDVLNKNISPRSGETLSAYWERCGKFVNNPVSMELFRSQNSEVLDTTMRFLATCEVTDDIPVESTKKWWDIRRFWNKKTIPVETMRAQGEQLYGGKIPTTSPPGEKVSVSKVTSELQRIESENISEVQKNIGKDLSFWRGIGKGLGIAFTVGVLLLVPIMTEISGANRKIEQSKVMKTRMYESTTVSRKLKFYTKLKEFLETTLKKQMTEVMIEELFDNSTDNNRSDSLETFKFRGVVDEASKLGLLFTKNINFIHESTKKEAKEAYTEMYTEWLTNVLTDFFKEHIDELSASDDIMNKIIKEYYNVKRNENYNGMEGVTLHSALMFKLPSITKANVNKRLLKLYIEDNSNDFIKNRVNRILDRLVEKEKEAQGSKDSTEVNTKA